MAGRGYVLWNLANEIERLGFQHDVWAEGFRALWLRGGVTAGTQVLDAGCGPGYASLELAKLVGDAGKVTAIDFTREYLQHLRQQVATASIDNITVLESDLHSIPLPDACCDVVFVKFVLLFIPNLGQVLHEFCRVLRPGGRLLISDYAGGGGFSPPDTPLNELFEFLKKHYEGRADIEVGRVLPKELITQGLQLTSIVPEVRVGRLGDRVWQWTAMFISSVLDRFEHDGDLPSTKIAQHRQALTQLAKNPQAFYTSPLLLHFVATKPC